MPALWGQFGTLYAAALLGAVAILPYTLRLLRASGGASKVSPKTLAIAGVAQNAVLFSVVVLVGLLASRAVGLGAPYVASLVSGLPAPRPFAPVLRLALLTGG